jgi:acetyltransferase
MSRGREFISAASRVTKPVLLHKTNIHPITRRIAMTHTASLAVDDAVLDAAVRSAGVVRIGTVREMVNTTKIFRLPVLKGPRLAILSRSGGHAVIASDECARLGFTLPPLPKEFLEKARSKMRSGVVGLGNPLDLGDLYDLPFYSEMLDTICSLDTIDGVVVLFTYITSMGHDVPLEILKKAGKLSRKYDKPVAFCLISWGDVTRHARDGSGFPVFTTPEDALTALKHSLEHHNGQRGKGGPAAAPAPGSCADAASIISACRGRGEKMISYDALRVLKSAGIDAVATYLAHDADEVRSVAASIPTPLVMKIASPDVAHKSDAGGVATGITGPQEAVSQALEMGDRVAARVPGARIDGFILQETAPEGVEVFIGAGRDPSFGPFVTVGLGGVFVEVLRDTATGLAPLDAAGALKLIESLKGAPLLKGARGRPPCDLDALCSAIVKVSNLIACVPEISGIDINPAVAYPRGLGLLAVDARMTLEAP